MLITCYILGTNNHGHFIFLEFVVNYNYIIIIHYITGKNTTTNNKYFLNLISVWYGWVQLYTFKVMFKPLNGIKELLLFFLCAQHYWTDCDHKHS